MQSVGNSRFAVVPGAAAAEVEPEAFEHACEKLVRRHCVLRAAKPEKFPGGTVSAHNSVHLAIQEGKFARSERQFNRSGFAGTERDVPEAAQFLHRPSDRADLVANLKLNNFLARELAGVA